MKTLRNPLKLMLLFPIAAVFFLHSSFTSRPGGEGFEVFQNDKLLFRQFGENMKNIKSLELTKASARDQITVKYYHCGRPAKDRHLIIKTSDNKELKNWQFANLIKTDPGMSFRVGDVLALSEKSPLNVYYRSSEMPNARLLISLVVRN